jgi:peptidoglycan L-alanyl-D-glutamate endopeptidase CwlK
MVTIQNRPAAMANLREGSSGPGVLRLQTSLRAAGFSPGALDGSFGAATLAALLSFQKSENLYPDGIAGAETLAALRFAPALLPKPSGMPPLTLADAVRMFPGAPEDNVAAHLPIVLNALQAAGLTPAPIVLAALATIRAETAGFAPISEGISPFNTSPGGAPFDLYDHRRDLGNRGPTDGARYRGRGFVQLTGRDSYMHYGKLVGVPDLADAPDRANDPAIAAALLAAFLNAVRVPLRQALEADELATARRLVNGGTNGLDNFVDAYRTGQALLAA